MDQKFVAGIGNIYSDEILFAAGLRYDRLSDSLSAQEIRRLYRAMVETLTEAVKHRGSSLADEQYRDLYGAIGDYQGQHQVYDREGQACRRCRNSVVQGEGQRPLRVPLRALPDLTCAAFSGRDAETPRARRDSGAATSRRRPPPRRGGVGQRQRGRGPGPRRYPR